MFIDPSFFRFELVCFVSVWMDINKPSRFPASQDSQDLKVSASRYHSCTARSEDIRRVIWWTSLLWKLLRKIMNAVKMHLIVICMLNIMDSRINIHFLSYISCWAHNKDTILPTQTTGYLKLPPIHPNHPNPGFHRSIALVFSPIFATKEELLGSSNPEPCSIRLGCPKWWCHWQGI